MHGLIYEAADLHQNESLTSVAVFGIVLIAFCPGIEIHDTMYVQGVPAKGSDFARL